MPILKISLHRLRDRHPNHQPFGRLSCPALWYRKSEKASATHPQALARAFRERSADDVRRVSSLRPQRSSPGSISATVAPQTVIFIWMFGSLSIFPVHVKGHHYGGGDLFGRAEWRGQYWLL